MIRAVQKAAYEPEINALTKKQPLAKQSTIVKLNPFLDEDKLLRVGGRLRHAVITFDQQHQIILPKGHFSSLLLFKMHWSNMHAGPQHIIGALNESKSAFVVFGSALNYSVNSWLTFFHFVSILLAHLQTLVLTTLGPTWFV